MTLLTLRPRWLVGGLALLIVLALLAGRPVHILLIEDLPEEQPVYARAVRPGDRLSLGFLHSVEHCRIWDHLKIDDDYGLMVVATEFAESRTGLPYAAFGEEVFERRQDHFRISNMHRPVPEIYQWVDARYQNTLKFNGDTPVQLASLAGNTLLHLRIDRLNLAEWAWLKAELSWRNRSF
jgi:hypothetical protein